MLVRSLPNAPDFDMSRVYFQKASSNHFARLGETIAVVEASALSGGRSLVAHLRSSIVLYAVFHAGVIGPILDLAKGIFKFALHLLGKAFQLEARIASPLARFSLRTSHHLIERTVQSVLIHLPTSVVSTVLVSNDALELNSSARADPESTFRPKCMRAAELVCSAAWCCLAHLLVRVAATVCSTAAVRLGSAARRRGLWCAMSWTWTRSAGVRSPAVYRGSASAAYRSRAA